MDKLSKTAIVFVLFLIFGGAFTIVAGLVVLVSLNVEVVLFAGLGMMVSGLGLVGLSALACGVGWVLEKTETIPVSRVQPKTPRSGTASGLYR